MRRKPDMFRCPVCQHNSLLVEIDRKEGIAKISCINCKLNRTMEISEDEDVVDVYARFVDLFYQ